MSFLKARSVKAPPIHPLGFSSLNVGDLNFRVLCSINHKQSAFNHKNASSLDTLLRKPFSVDF